MEEDFESWREDERLLNRQSDLVATKPDDLDNAYLASRDDNGRKKVRPFWNFTLNEMLMNYVDHLILMAFWASPLRNNYISLLFYEILNVLK